MWPYNCMSLNKCKALSEGLAWQLGTKSKTRFIIGAITCVRTIVYWYWVKHYSACAKSRPIAICHKSDEGWAAGTIIGEQRIWLEILEQTHLFDAKLTLCLVPKISIANMKTFCKCKFCKSIPYVYGQPAKIHVWDWTEAYSIL